MERIIEEFINKNNVITKPYLNHYGCGCTVGSGNANGTGKAFVRSSDNNTFSGKDFISYNGNKLYLIDDYLLYITHVHEPWAKGEIIKNDLTTQTCYIGKINNIIVVSDSIRNVLELLRKKIMNTYKNEDDIAAAFVYAHPDYNKQYDWEEMVFWHSITNYSCSEGRNNFSKLSNKKKGDTASPKELIELAKNTIASSSPIAAMQRRVISITAVFIMNIIAYTERSFSVMTRLLVIGWVRRNSAVLLHSSLASAEMPRIPAKIAPPRPRTFPHSITK